MVQQRRSLAPRGGATSPAFRSRVPRQSWPLDVAVLAGLLLLALWPRLTNLHLYSGLFDEGIRIEQLLLMEHGYRPFRQIFAAQGPLLLDALFPLYQLFNLVFDPSLLAARLVAVTYSLIGLAGLYWLGSQLTGRAGALLAALLLTLSPLYLEGSRLALAEVPALAPAILAVGCALRYLTTGARAWLVVSGLLLTLSLLMKPITLAAAPAIALAALLRGRQGLRDVTLIGIAMVVLAGLIVWLLGFNEVFEQIGVYRLLAYREGGGSLTKNVAAMRLGFGYEPSALLPLAVSGGLALLVYDWRRALPLLVWAAAGFALLLVYSPLHGKHLVIAIPGAALLAGAGWVAIARLLPRRLRLPAGAQIVAVVLPALAAGWYLASLLPLLPRTGELLKVTRDDNVDPAFDQYADAVATLRALTDPDDVIVTDQPYLAFLAERRVPPQLVDTALTRIRSRSLTGARAIAAADADNPKVIVFWGDRLRSLPAFKQWVEANYRLVKIYNRRGDTDRAVYLRRDADFAAARDALTAHLTDLSVDFGGEIELRGAMLDRDQLSAGQGATLTLHWSRLRPSQVDYHTLIDLRDSAGQVRDDQEESLGGGGDGTSQWPPGRWLVQSSFVIADQLNPGQYTVTLSLYDSRARAIVPMSGGADRGLFELATLAVR